MMGVPKEDDRRLAPGAQTLGRAVLYTRSRAYDYRVENVSAGGAFLIGGPVLPVGERVRVVLRLGEIPADPIEARVVWRAEGEESGVALVFVELDAMLQDLIQDVVLAALRGVYQPTRPVDGSVELAALLP